LITTIRVVHRANSFASKGNVLKGIGIGLVRARYRLELYKITISMKGMELSKAMRSVWPRMYKRVKRERLGGNTGEDIKRVSRNNVREARDYSDAVLGIGGLKEGSIIG
jgi:hypothetical protein